MAQGMSLRSVVEVFNRALNGHGVDLLSRMIQRAQRRQAVRVFSAKSYVKKALGKKSLKPSLPVHGLIGLAKATFVDVACGDDDALDALRSLDVDLISELDEKCIKSVSETGVNPWSFVTNAVAHTVASNIVMKASNTQLTQSGRVVFVSGEIGSGKTTLAFWSTAIPLSAMGLEWRAVLRIISSLWVQSLDDFIRIARFASELASRGGFLPFLVLEDAAVVFSKYQLAPVFSESPSVPRAVARLGEAFQVIREGVGTLIINAAPSALAKPLREMSGIRVEGMVVSTSRYRRTLWLASHHGGSPVDVFSTIHPVIKTPDELMTVWLKRKLELRERVLRKAEELMSGGAGGEAR